METRAQQREDLRVYSALGKRKRLGAFLAINENPGMNLNDLIKKTKTEKKLLAYHLAILRVTGLIEHDREGCYSISDKGKVYLGKLRTGTAKLRTESTAN